MSGLEGARAAAPSVFAIGAWVGSGFVWILLLSLSALAAGVGLAGTQAIVGAAFAAVGIGGAMALWGARTGRDLQARLGWWPVPTGALAAASVGMVGLQLSTYAVLGHFDLLEAGNLGALRRAVRSADGGEWFALVAVLTVAPAFGEEICFRGFVLNAWSASAGPRGALWGSTVLFALVHVDVVQTPVMLVFGLYVGGSVLRTGSLWTGIVAHAVNNGVAALLLDGDGPPLGPAAVIGVLLTVGGTVGLARASAVSRAKSTRS